MNVISFCINGKMAHFRKYYSNSTALSYIVPPVTTVKGIIAGLMGFERDSYYSLFANDKCKVSIIIEKAIKKTTQTMNLLKVESLNDLNGAGKNRTQNNTEFIIPKDIRHGIVSYKIVFYHDDDQIMNELQKYVCTDYEHYYSHGISFYMGSSQCSGWISDGRVINIEEKFSDDLAIDMYSTIRKDKIQKIEINNVRNLSILKEETITEFDENRYITENSKKDIIVSATCDPISVKLKKGTKYYKMEEKNIIFLE